MLKLNDDQRMLQDTVRPFMKDEGSITKQLRHWRDIECKDGFGHGLWEEFGKLGLTGIMVPESQGGSGLGQVEANVVLEEIGRNLTPSPFLTTAVAAVRALEGTAHADAHFAGIVEGKTVAALAIDEGPHHDPSKIAMTATRSGNGFVLNGAKQFAVHANSADLILTAARTENGLAFFAVKPDADGLTRENVTLTDSSKAARLTYENVEVDADALIGEGDAPLMRALAAGRAGAASELVGVAAGAFEMTNAYLRERKQFGVAIGSFQALQHRAAHLYGEIEIARAATLKAAQLLDEGSDRAARAVHVAKAKAGAVARLAVQEAVQMHGGIGMTDEHDIGFYMKRQAVVDELFGSPTYHARMVASA